MSSRCPLLLTVLLFAPGSLVAATEDLAIPSPAVRLYAGAGFRGGSWAITHDVADLAATAFGDDVARSIEVDPGCTASLFVDAHFRGTTVTLDYDHHNLAGTDLGHRTLSSLQVRCAHRAAVPEDRPEVVFFAKSNYRGKSQQVAAALETLTPAPLSGKVGSVRVGRSCSLVLHGTEASSRPRLTLTASAPDLPATGFGSQRIRSAEVRCHGGAVTLYSEPHFGGEAISFDTFERDLSKTVHGARRVGSVRVAAGCHATLFNEVRFRGVRYGVGGAARDLHSTPLRGQNVASLIVKCR